MIVDIHSHIKRNLSCQEEEEKKLLLDMEKNKVDVRVVSAMDGWTVEEGSRYISGFVSAHPGRLVGCAVINPKEEDCNKKAAEVLTLPGMAMLEFQSVEHGYYPDTCDGIERVLQVAEKKRGPGEGIYRYWRPIHASAMAGARKETSGYYLYFPPYGLL